MTSSRWLEFALDDIDSAEIMLREGKYNNVCYFAQQAAEKALKGFLHYNRVNPPRIHDLVELIKLCQQVVTVHPFKVFYFHGCLLGSSCAEMLRCPTPEVVSGE